MTLSNKSDQQQQQQQQHNNNSNNNNNNNDTKSSTLSKKEANQLNISNTNNYNNNIINNPRSSSVSKLLASSSIPSPTDPDRHHPNNPPPPPPPNPPHRFTPSKRKATTMLGFGKGDKKNSSANNNNNNSSSTAAAAAAAAAAASIPALNDNVNDGHQLRSSTNTNMAAPSRSDLNPGDQQQQQQQNSFDHLHASGVAFQTPLPYSVVKNYPSSKSTRAGRAQLSQQQQQHLKNEPQLPSSSQQQQQHQQAQQSTLDMNENAFDQQHPTTTTQSYHSHHMHTSIGMHNIHSHDASNAVKDEEMSTAQRLCGVTIESPSSPGGGVGVMGGGYKRMRSSADSDAGSSSCKDIDESDVLAPDSVPALVAELRQLLNYVASKPTLQHGSASFIRDYLRTMLLQNSKAAEEAIEQANKNIKLENMNHNELSTSTTSKLKYPYFNNHNYQNQQHHNDEFFKRIPDELIKHVLSFLDGKNLAKSREVCKKWNDVCDDQLWKCLCLERWKALESDDAIWKLIDRNIDIKNENRWRLIYPKVSKTPQWKCRLQKTGRFICNLVAHQISGASLSESGLPNVLVVERRFNIMHLATFVLPDASVLYFEPEKESDRAGFDDFIQYLDKRTRAGLALEEQRRFIFIPPCEYTRNQVDYQGKSLLGVVQNAYPPLAP